MPNSTSYRTPAYPALVQICYPQCSTSFYTNESLSVLKEEIPTFNKGLEIVGNPYWLTREGKHQDQITDTVCIAFATEQQAQKAICNRLYLLGISVRVEKLHSTPASTQCHNCQRYGHTEAID
jgi:hypothetical protein